MKKFEWDERKNEKNQLKHHISFENASKVFDDENRLQFVSDHDNERRYVTIGKSFKAIIAVVYTIRNFVYRLISARPAGKTERERYLTKSLSKQDEEYDKKQD